MTDFSRLKQLVSEALELAPEERSAYLEAHCSDPDLLAEAHALLAHDFADLDGAVGAKVAAEAADAFAPDLGTIRISGYELIESLGAGGMGVVWRARQVGALDREVALKLIRPGFDSAKVVARFESERRSLARMEHPNIAQVFDAGTTSDGLPWFAMELVEGEPIHHWCDERALDVDARLRLFVGVCQGVQHAHQKGIIHRDLKPSNILVASRDGIAVPKIIDFGISKALGEAGDPGTMMTIEGQILGTPEYMSPERLAGDETDVDIRTDVYSLGVLLYHLLTGTLPFDRSSTGSRVAGTSTGGDPPRPSTRVTDPAPQTDPLAQRRGTRPDQLRRRLDGDLDWITLKALAPRLEDRYATVQGLLNDIERHRQGQPVSAGPPTVRYRTGKFVRRHRAPLGVAALVLLLLTGGLVESNRQRVRAETAREEADSVTTFLSDMLASIRADEMGREVTVRQVLDRASQTVDAELAIPELVRARLLTTMGRTYRALGEAGTALERLDEAVRIRTARLGPRAPETLESRFHHAVALRDDGRIGPAIAELEAVLSARRDILDPRDALTLSTLKELGAAYQQNGDTDAARRAFEESHAGFRSARGERDPDTVDAALNLGNFLAENGEPDRAEPLIERSLQICREDFPTDHPRTVSAIQSLALLRYDQGRTAECEQLLTEVLDARRRMHGNSHRATLESMINLASVRSNSGDVDSAIELLEEALPLCRETLGVEHRVTLTCMNNLAYAYGVQGRDAEAESLLEETLEIRRRVRGDSHLFTLITWNNVGELYLRTGRPAQAEEVHRRVLELRRASLGEDHPHVMISMTHLASALRDQGLFDEAAALYEQSWQKQTEILGADHPDARITATEALKSSELAGRPAEADRWRERIATSRNDP